MTEIQLPRSHVVKMSQPALSDGCVRSGGAWIGGMIRGFMFIGRRGHGAGGPYTGA